MYRQKTVFCLFVFSWSTMKVQRSYFKIRSLSFLLIPFLQNKLDKSGWFYTFFKHCKTLPSNSIACVQIFVLSCRETLAVTLFFLVHTASKACIEMLLVIGCCIYKLTSSHKELLITVILSISLFLNSGFDFIRNSNFFSDSTVHLTLILPPSLL